MRTPLPPQRNNQMFSIVISLLPTVLKLLGFADYAQQLLDKQVAAKKAQDFANMPTTKQERTNAADHGDL